MIHPFRLPRVMALLAGVTTCGLVASACSMAPAQGGPDSAENPAIEQAVIEELNTKIESYSKDPEFRAPGAEFDARSVMADKHIYSIPFSMNIEFNTKIVASMAAAAEGVGFKFSPWSSTGDPTSWVQGMNTAITAKPDLIDTVTNQPATFLPQVQAAVDAGIKVVDSHSFGIQQKTPESLDKLGVEYVNGPYELGGELMADWAIAKSGGKANVLVLTAFDSSSSPALQEGVKSQFAKYCPDTCKVKIENIPVNSWATRVQPTVQAAVTRDPTIDWILPTYDAMAQPAAAGLQATQAQGRVKIATFNGSPAVVDLVREGKVDMVVGENLDWIGKAVIDSEMRFLAGLPVPKDPHIPVKIFSRDNAKDAGVPAVASQGYGDAYKDGYRQLWGLK